MSIPKIIPIDTLGTPTFETPLKKNNLRFYNGEAIATGSRTKDLAHLEAIDDIVYYELAGPREKLFFNPKEVTVGIVTCGGLCPGLNDVVRALTFCALESYGVKRVLGFKYGYEGLVAKYYHQPIELTTDNTDEIHEKGGTILKTSRGGQDTDEIINTLLHYGVNILFTIGGDGTLKGANAIGTEIIKRGLKISVAGIPKTIDNDVDIIDKSFGFETSFDVACPIVRDAHNEANGAFNGIAIVKLMGRDSGFIAASTAISMPVVNFVLIPEMDFQLEGENGFLESLKKRLQLKKHAVIVVAEGAGQHLFENNSNEVKDASGNIQHKDIGLLLQQRIKEFFNSTAMRTTVKYIDPSYIIRSAPANANDSRYCNRLAYHVVHGAMAGKTKFVIGIVHDRFVYLPITDVTKKRKKIDMEGEFWFGVLQSTGQPFSME